MLVASEQEHCPSNLVNFWKNFAFNTDNYDSVPAFLLQNNCLRVRSSTAFHTAMIHRFDEPNNETYIHELYAQLDWPSEKSVIQQQ